MTLSPHELEERRRAGVAQVVWGEDDGSGRWQEWRRGVYTPRADGLLHEEDFLTVADAEARVRGLMRRHRGGRIRLGFIDVKVSQQRPDGHKVWVTTPRFTGPDPSARERVIRAAEKLREQNALTYFLTVKPAIRAEVNRRANERREKASA